MKLAEDDLKRAYKIWKRAGKPLEKTSRSWQRYANSRSKLRQAARREDHQKTIYLNNFLLHAAAPFNPRETGVFTHGTLCFRCMANLSFKMIVKITG